MKHKDSRAMDKTLAIRAVGSDIDSSKFFQLLDSCIVWTRYRTSPCMAAGTTRSRATELVASRKKFRLCHQKNCDQLSAGCEWNVAKPVPKVRLCHTMLITKLAVNIQSSYDHGVKLQSWTKIGKSEKIVLFQTLPMIKFYVVSTK